MVENANGDAIGANAQQLGGNAIVALYVPEVLSTSVGAADLDAVDKGGVEIVNFAETEFVVLAYLLGRQFDLAAENGLAIFACPRRPKFLHRTGQLNRLPPFCSGGLSDGSAGGSRNPRIFMRFIRAGAGFQNEGLACLPWHSGEIDTAV